MPNPTTILVVDDEPIILDLCLLILRDIGYQLVSATDGAAAVQTYRNATPPVDLVILDMALPSMDGSAVFHALRALNPHARVLLSTGYIGADVAALLNAGARGVVQKPFRVAELTRAVATALA